MNWREIDPRTNIPLEPKGLDLIGQSYQVERGPMTGHMARVIGVDSMFPTERVLVECRGARWSVRQEYVRRAMEEQRRTTSARQSAAPQTAAAGERDDA